MYGEQLTMFEMPSEIPCMSLEEMRKHEWVVCWSGGKDSTATIIKMRELGIPIKFIVFVLMMWDDDAPAILPIMYDFVMRAKAIFEAWGYKVIIQRSAVNAKDKCLMRFSDKTTKKFLIGKPYGARAFIGGGVYISKVQRACS